MKFLSDSLESLPTDPRKMGDGSAHQRGGAGFLQLHASVGNGVVGQGGGGAGELMVACVLCVCACCSVAVVFALRPLALSCAPLQMLSLMLWTCTTVQQGCGRRLSSAWRAGILQLHLSGTWLCSPGVVQEVRCCVGRRGGRRVDGCVRVCAFCSVAVVFALRPLAFSCTADGFYSNAVDLYNNFTSSPSPVPPLLPQSASPIPSWINAGAAVASGQVPRVLELVQFLSIYCTLLSSQQQDHVHEFQITSFTGAVSSQAEYCRICPGNCIEPTVLVVPTFAPVSCLAALTAIMLAFDSYRRRGSAATSLPVQDRLLAADAASSTSAAGAHLSLRHTVAAFCIRYCRSLMETASSYVLMPSMFVFVLNVWPASFAHAAASHRAMIVMTPVITLLFRSLVIHKRLVDLTRGDQKQLFVSCACNCGIAVVLAVYFVRDRDARAANPSFSSDSTPQYIVLALLLVQLIAHAVIRHNAAEASVFDNMDWPWQSAPASASTAVFSFSDLRSRLVVGSIRNSAISAAAAAAKFLLMNYLILSQMAMVVAGLASSGMVSSSRLEAASVAIGAIPLIISSDDDDDDGDDDDDDGDNEDVASAVFVYHIGRRDGAVLLHIARSRVSSSGLNGLYIEKNGVNYLFIISVRLA